MLATGNAKAMSYTHPMRGLYVIIDPDHCLGRDPLWVAQRALAGGCAALQLRAKNLHDKARLPLARALAEAAHNHGVPFWLNDRADLALLVGADGLHLGQEDLPIAEARKLVGSMLIGRSTHSLAQAQAAASEGTDVLGFGPVFATRSKQNPDPVVGLEGLAQVTAAVNKPIVAIGGIELAHATELARSGASYAAVISAVCGAPDPELAARTLHQVLLAQAATAVS